MLNALFYSHPAPSYHLFKMVEIIKSEEFLNVLLARNIHRKVIGVPFLQTAHT